MSQPVVSQVLMDSPRITHLGWINHEFRVDHLSIQGRLIVNSGQINCESRVG